MKLHKNMNNKEVARLLRAISAAYEIKGESRFKIIAYDRASTAVEHATSEVKDLWEDNQLKNLTSIGTSIASHLDELFKTGRVKHFEEVMKGLPKAMFELLDIPGVGAKTAWKLCEKLNISNSKTAIERLKLEAEKGEIRLIEGFGEESERKILASIQELTKRKTRILLPYAWELAQKVIEYMKKEKAVLQIDPLGSLRRMAATVGDLDFSVATNKPKKVIDHFLKFPQVKEVLVSGGNTARILLRSSQQIDLKTQRPQAYGAMLQHFTGSKQHNIHLREIAIKKNKSLSEYGIKIKKGSKFKLCEFDSEESFYQALDMEWIPPELREDTGEIEAAQDRKLPNLVKLNQIKGDLHLHSDFPIEPSHDIGDNSMLEMIVRAKELDYEYLAFCEHNPSISRHSEDQINSILSKKKELIDKINYTNNKCIPKFQIFNSLEVDIKPNGDLAITKKGLETLDFAMVSIHSSFAMNKKKMTERVLKALNVPKVKILGHPTGRMLEQREGFELNWEQIFEFCVKNKKALEINAYPRRLDLPDTLVKNAVKLGVKMIIGTDSHSVSEMDLMRYGVSVAQRGWAEKKAILNTLNYDKISQWLFDN